MRLITLCLMAVIALSACCAPAATLQQQATAFKAIVVEADSRSALVQLDSGQLLRLTQLNETLNRGERYYITGQLFSNHTIEVESISSL